MQRKRRRSKRKLPLLRGKRLLKVRSQDDFTMANVPHEIIFDILSRLPVKSLCRFKCVSKPWRILINSTDFIQSHRNKTQKFRLTVSCKSKSLCSVDVEQFDDNGNADIEAIKLEYPLMNQFRKPGSNSIVGSCNGLICMKLVTSSNWEAFIYNPCTREFKAISEFFYSSADASFPLKRLKSVYYGFGYAPAIDDYRLVKINKGLVSVYSLRTSSLTGKLQYIPYNLPLYIAPGTPLNGAVHWVVNLSHRGENRCAIAAFDLAEETFTDFPFPDDVPDYLNRDILSVLDGCICLTHYYNTDRHTKFWMMKEYGVKESWVKIEMTIPHSRLSPMCLVKNGKALLAFRQWRLVLCNLENGICEDVAIRGWDNLLAWDIYVESLVSPNMGNEV